MSGIAAILNFDGRPAQAEHIHAMTGAMAHRGPDGIAHWVNGSVALGQCALHSTAEALQTTLPLTDPSGNVVLIMDGRLDNYTDLRDLLRGRGIALRSAADAELVLQAYLAFGEDCTAHLEGDFAILIWDQARKRAFGIRDSMGHRPFYYARSGAAVSIASEPAALLSLPWIEAVPNAQMIAQFAAAEWLSRTDTLWQGIKRLPAAHAIAISETGDTLGQYWSPDPERPCPAKTEEDFAHLYQEVFTDAVKRLSRSHKPLGCEASGGLDSSAIFATAVAAGQDGTLAAPAIAGFTLDMGDWAGADDLPFARALGRHLDRRIAECAPVVQPFDWYRQHAMAVSDFPGFPNNGVLQQELWAQAKSEGCVAVFNGLGGDQWLDSSTGALYADGFATLDPRVALRIIRGDLGHLGPWAVTKRVLRHGVAGNLPTPIRSRLRAYFPGASRLRPPVLTGMLGDHWETAHSTMEAGRPAKGTHKQALFASDWSGAFRAMAIDITEREAAYAGIEYRMPYEDRRVFELLYSAPAWWLRHGDTTKLAHRRAMTDRLPPAILARKTKASAEQAFAELTRDSALFSKALAEAETAGLDPQLCLSFERTYQATSKLGDNTFQRWCMIGCLLALAATGR